MSKMSELASLAEEAGFPSDADVDEIVAYAKDTIDSSNTILRDWATSVMEVIGR